MTFSWGDRLRGHEELQLVDARVFVDGDAAETALGIAGHEDAAVDQGVGVDLIPERRGDLSGAAGQIHLGRADRPFRLEVAGEVRLQVLRRASPGRDELLVEVRLILQVGTIRPEEGSQGLGRQLAGGLVVAVADGHGRAQPLVVDEFAHRLGLDRKSVV